MFRRSGFWLLSFFLASNACALTLKLPAEHAVKEATLELPVSLPEGQRVPAILVFGGFESAAHVLGLIHPSLPVALASFDYPFKADRNLRFPESLGALGEARDLFPATLQGIVDVAHALAKRPEIDPSRIIVIGASFGAPFALAAAARSPEISGVVIVHGFGRIADTAEHVILRSWLPRYGWIARPAAWMISRAGWVFLRGEGVSSPEAYAGELRPSQSVLMITAENDSFIPRESSDSLWAALQNSRARAIRELMPTDHLMPGADQLIQQIIARVELWLTHP